MRGVPIPVTPVALPLSETSNRPRELNIYRRNHMAILRVKERRVSFNGTSSATVRRKITKCTSDRRRIFRFIRYEYKTNRANCCRLLRSKKGTVHSLYRRCYCARYFNICFRKRYLIIYTTTCNSGVFTNFFFWWVGAGVEIAK